MDYPFTPKTLAHAENRTNLLTFSKCKDLYGDKRPRTTLGEDLFYGTGIEYLSVGALGNLKIDQPYEIRTPNAIFPDKPYGGMVFNIFGVVVTDD